MKSAGAGMFLGLLLVTAAAGAEVSGCGVRKGLYEEWLAQARRGSGSRKGLKETLLRPSPAPAPNPERQQAIEEEYQAFFQCLSDVAARQDEKALQSSCDEATGDRLASMVCQSVIYVKNGRTGSKEFLDGFPSGKKGAEMVWDLSAITGAGQEKIRKAAMFLPDGPAYKLIDELFLLVLDGKETAAAKYFTIAASAPEADERHVDEQIEILLREAPVVVVKEWAVLRQYQPKLRKLLPEMSRAELQKVRQGLAGFCAKDNLDCPEILKVFGRPE
jgi:hypothetical protein